MERKDEVRKAVKRQIDEILRSMDFICGKYLGKKKMKPFFDIYQQLGLAWEFMGLQCGHWDGYKRTRDRKMVCRICGRVKGTDDLRILLPAKGPKRIGRKARPTSGKVFENEKRAAVLMDSVDFHGARLSVKVHNAFRSRLLRGKHEISVAAGRTVKLEEDGIECSVDDFIVCVRMKKRDKKRRGREFGGFPSEMRKKELKNFPVIFSFDENRKFLGLEILRPASSRREKPRS